jgi:hypothetical protein
LDEGACVGIDSGGGSGVDVSDKTIAETTKRREP